MEVLWQCYEHLWRANGFVLSVEDEASTDFERDKSEYSLDMSSGHKNNVALEDSADQLRSTKHHRNGATSRGGVEAEWVVQYSEKH